MRKHLVVQLILVLWFTISALCCKELKIVYSSNYDLNCDCKGKYYYYVSKTDTIKLKCVYYTNESDGYKIEKKEVAKENKRCEKIIYRSHDLIINNKIKISSNAFYNNSLFISNSRYNIQFLDSLKLELVDKTFSDIYFISTEIADTFWFAIGEKKYNINGNDYLTLKLIKWKTQNFGNYEFSHQSYF